MTLFVHLTFGADPGDPAHAKWLMQFALTVAAVPFDVTLCESEKIKELFKPRDVNIIEMDAFMWGIRNTSYTFRADVRRMWKMLARVHSSVMEVEAPETREEIEAWTVPLADLKQLTIGDFEGSNTTMQTRKKLLAFIATLH